jgi:hypothetical protein
MSKDAPVIEQRESDFDKAEIKRPPPKPRKLRVARAKVSATRLDGSIPATLGGKLPPVSVLARREFGLGAAALRVACRIIAGRPRPLSFYKNGA